MSSAAAATTCPICLENIDTTKNMCYTPCGHMFCFNCMVKCLKTNSKCPYCRQVIDEEHEEDNKTLLYESGDYLLESDDDDDDEDEDEDEDDDDEDEIDLEDEEDDGCEIEEIERGFKENNITYLNMISILINRYPNNTTRSMIKRLEKKMFDVISELDEEYKQRKTELKLMKMEDVRQVTPPVTDEVTQVTYLI